MFRGDPDAGGFATANVTCDAIRDAERMACHDCEACAVTVAHQYA